MGFPEELLLKEPVDEIYKCFVCKDVMEAPTTVTGCGHTFCRGCVSQYKECPFGQNCNGKKGKNEAGEGGQLLTKPAVGLFVEELNALEIGCKYSSSGCSYAGKVGDIDKHHEFCYYSPAITALCPNNCGLRLGVGESHDCIEYLKTKLKEQTEECERAKTCYEIMRKMAKAYGNEHTKTDLETLDVVSAKMRWKLDNISQLKDARESPYMLVGGYPWRLKALPYPAGFGIPGDGTTHLAIFVKCDGIEGVSNWSRSAVAVLKISSSKPGVPAYCRTISHNFNTIQDDWGFSKFIEWSYLFDKSKGYVREDCVIIEVRLKLSAHSENPSPPPAVAEQAPAP